MKTKEEIFVEVFDAVDLEMEQYEVGQGDKVTMDDYDETYVVTNVVIPDAVVTQLGDKIWGFFILTNTKTGGQYSHAIPRMNEGTVSIKDLLGLKTGIMKSVKFMKREGKIRYYSVEHEYVTQVRVEDR